MTEEGDANLLYFPGFEVKEGDKDDIDYVMNDEVLAFLHALRKEKLDWSVKVGCGSPATQTRV